MLRGNLKLANVKCYLLSDAVKRIRSRTMIDDKKSDKSICFAKVWNELQSMMLALKKERLSAKLPYGYLPDRSCTVILDALL